MSRPLQLCLRVAVGAGLTGAGVVMAAAPALAASSLSITPGTTVTSDDTVTATGTDAGDSTAIGQSRTLTLDLATPDGSTKQWSSGSVASTQKATVTGSFGTAGRINGDYTFTLKVNSTTAATKTVAVRVPPATVSGVSAAPSGSVAHFAWSANNEPDLAGYDIVDVTGGGRRDLTPGGVGTEVCSGGSCGVDIDFGSSARGTSKTFVVDALRYTSPAHSATIASADSSPVSVSFPAPASPSPSSTGSVSSGGGTSGGTTSGGSTSGGTTSAGGSTGGATTGGGSSTSTGGAGRGISSSHANAALKAYLPTFTAGAAPALPSVVTEVKPLPEGTFKPTLAYPDQVVGQTLHKGGSAPIASVRNEVVRVLNVQALWKSLAGAALILLVAAHLRAWVAGAEAQD